VLTSYKIRKDLGATKKKRQDLRALTVREKVGTNYQKGKGEGRATKTLPRERSCAGGRGGEHPGSGPGNMVRSSGRRAVVAELKFGVVRGGVCDQRRGDGGRRGRTVAREEEPRRR
jgi:hypothetical protein